MPVQVHDAKHTALRSGSNIPLSVHGKPSRTLDNTTLQSVKKKIDISYSIPTFEHNMFIIQVIDKPAFRAVVDLMSRQLVINGVSNPRVHTK